MLMKTSHYKKIQVAMTVLLLFMMILSACSPATPTATEAPKAAPTEAPKTEPTEAPKTEPTEAPKAEEPAPAKEEPTATTAPTKAPEAAAPLYKMDPAVEMSVIKSADTFFGYYEGQTPGDNDVYDLWERTTGIRFVNKVETAMEGYEKQVKLAIASDDLPDVIAASASEFEEMIQNDMLVDMRPYIDQYMDPVVKEKLMAFDGKLFAPVTRGEAIYGIPATSNVEGSLRTLWIRKDWLEAVGRDVPKTMEEVIDLAIAFTEEDPDGNGKKDTWGLPIDRDGPTSRLLNTFEIMANACGYYPARLIAGADGKIAYGSLEPGLKDILQQLQDLYKMGAIDPEFASKDFVKTDEHVGQGRYGLWMGVFWKPVDPGFATTYKENIPWIAAPIPPCKSTGVYKPFVAFPVSAYYGVRKDYEHPEALIVAVNQYLDSDSLKKPGSFQKEMLALSNKEGFKGIPLNNWAALQWQDPTYFSSSPIVRAMNDPGFDPENPAYQVHMQAYSIISGLNNSEPWQIQQFKDIFIESIGVHEKYPPESYVFSAYFGAPTPTQQKQGSILEDLEVKTFIDIVTGNAPVSSYDDFIKQYLELGGDKILQELNE